MEKVWDVKIKINPDSSGFISRTVKEENESCAIVEEYVPCQPTIRIFLADEIDDIYPELTGDD